MITMLQNWDGCIEINGQEYDRTVDFKPVSGPVRIKLYPKAKKPVQATVNNDSPVYRITVKAYMTREATPTFDFMAKWNNNNPMPLRTMVGTKLKETPGMVYMELHGDIYAEKIHTCMKCGRHLTNPISQYFGIGPECGGHNYVNPFNSEQELKMAVESYRKQLKEITWTGWVIKSSILEQEEI